MQLPYSANEQIKKIYILTILQNFNFTNAIWLLYFVNAVKLPTLYVGIVVSFGIIFQLILEIPTGIISDKFGHHTNMKISSWAVTLGYIGMIPCYYFGDKNVDLALLLFQQFMSAVAHAACSGSQEAIVHENLKKDNPNDFNSELIKVSSAQSKLGNITSVFAYIFGTLAYIIYPVLPLFIRLFVNISTFKITYGILPVSQKGEAHNKIESNFIFYFMKLIPFIILTVTMLSLSETSTYHFSFAEYLYKLNHMSETKVALLLGLTYTITSLLSFYAVTHLSKIYTKYSFTKGVIICSTPLIILYILNYFYLSLYGILLLMILGGITYSFIKIWLNVEINLTTPSKYRATTLSTASFINMVVAALIVLYIGYINEKTFNLEIMKIGLLAIPLFSLLGIFYLGIINRKIKK